MKILVTGGAGFIGSHLVERLLRDGHFVTVLDDLSTGCASNLADASKSMNYSFQLGSILDTRLIKELITDTEYIFHMAAAVGVFNIVKNPLSSLLTNIRGTENILENASAKKIPVFITSSSEVYGKNISDSLKESDDRILGSPTTLRWSYSEAKAVDESLAYAYHLEKGLETRIVRFFNTVGPRQLAAYGMVVPRFIKAALENSDIEIYGSGTQTRCFAHVYDVVDAIIAVSFSANTIGRVLNIGNNNEISINDLANHIIQATSSKSSIAHISYHEAYGDGFEDMERRVPNIELINQLVGWVPKRDLTLMVSDIISEMKQTL